jgi:hypothetical protein
VLWKLKKRCHGLITFKTASVLYENWRGIIVDFILLFYNSVLITRQLYWLILFFFGSRWVCYDDLKCVGVLVFLLKYLIEFSFNSSNDM